MEDGSSAAMLSERTVLVTRAKTEAKHLAQRVEAWGGRPIVLPLLEIRLCSNLQMQAARRAFNTFDAVAVTSANAVRAWFAAAGSAKPTAAEPMSSPVWYAVGAHTARVLADHGVQAVVPPRCKNGRDLARFVASQPAVPGRTAPRLLYLRGQLATPEVATQFAATGWSVRECICYQTHEAPWLEREWQAFVSAPAPRAVLLFSPSAVRSLVHHAGGGDQAEAWLPGTVIACVGTTTATACTVAGLPVHAVADRPDRDQLLTAAAEAMDAMRCDN